MSHSYATVQSTVRATVAQSNCHGRLLSSEPPVNNSKFPYKETLGCSSCKTSKLLTLSMTTGWLAITSYDSMSEIQGNLSFLLNKLAKIWLSVSRSDTTSRENLSSLCVT